MNFLSLFRRRPEPAPLAGDLAREALAADVSQLARDLTGIVAQYQYNSTMGGHSERRIYDTGRRPERRQA